MTETELLRAWRIALDMFDRNPIYPNAARLHRIADELRCISDDYQDHLDEADDILANL